MSLKTIHIVFKAHIDPVWLWPWQAGLDAALATCRSACDRLDRHPDIVFTKGEAWIYDQIEQVDPVLFKRIAAHIEAGRWEIAGGWWVQPDCNAASYWAWNKQIEAGRHYFESRFGRFPNIAMNVDSFGHAATLPKLLRDNGQEYYVMMRPMPFEMELPARLFRWRGYDDGPEVVTFRIWPNYNNRKLDFEHVRASLDFLPDGVDDTMCFAGFGDHGGGPTEEQIAWLRGIQDSVPGARLVFSSPSRYFEAIRKHIDSLPLVTGELQMHAVGCYSVHRGVKTAIRRAEHLAVQADSLLTSSSSEVDRAQIVTSWRNIAFAHFHDTMGGTCIPSAYQAILDQLGFACSVADTALSHQLRRKIAGMADHQTQRIIAWNPSDKPARGFVEFEPWLEKLEWEPHWRIVDSLGATIPFQRMHSESMSNMSYRDEAANDIWGFPRMVFWADLAPGELTWWAIDRSGNAPLAQPTVSATATEDSISSGTDVEVNAQTMRIGSLDLPVPRLDLIVDESDTWSHSTEQYNEQAVETARWGKPKIIDNGPLMASFVQEGSVGSSRLSAEWRVYSGESFAELRLQVHWLENLKILKLVLPFDGGQSRIDGISGGHLERENDGIERPLRDWTLVAGKLGIMCPDVYALDATPSRVRLTLLRSPWLAWHVPHPGGAPRATFADEGVHMFRFRFVAGPAANVLELDNQAIAIQRPLLFADLTKGMPPGLDPDALAQLESFR